MPKCKCKDLLETGEDLVPWLNEDEDHGLVAQLRRIADLAVYNIDHVHSLPEDILRNIGGMPWVWVFQGQTLQACVSEYSYFVKRYPATNQLVLVVLSEM